MVKALHRAGIEVILDVVYNHTAEGNHLGPMLSFKGIDNASYYRLMPDDPSLYMDFTGTGNSLNPVHPSVLRLIMDSLRYWVIDCHVDGFRFDLASALARELYDVDRLSAFFDVIHQDPVLSQVKLIAEPWDLGPGGYQVGNFPVLWTEWNGLYRDTMRDVWRGQTNVGRVRLALHGLERPLRVRRAPPLGLDQLRHRARRLHAGRPRLLQPEAQRGQPRGQPRRHGRQPLLELRRRGPDRRPRDQRAARAPAAQLPDHAAALPGRADDPRPATRSGARSAATTTPGARTTRSRGSTGSSTSGAQDLLEFTRRLLALRREHPIFHRTQFLNGQGSAVGPPGRLVVPARRPPDDRRRLAERRRPRARRLPQRPRASAASTRHGEPIVDCSFLLLLNAHHEDVMFALPPRRFGPRWQVELSTAYPHAPAALLTARGSAHVTARSLLLLRRAGPARAVSTGPNRAVRRPGRGRRAVCNSPVPSRLKRGGGIGGSHDRRTRRNARHEGPRVRLPARSAARGRRRHHPRGRGHHGPAAGRARHRPRGGRGGGGRRRRGPARGRRPRPGRPCDGARRDGRDLAPVRRGSLRRRARGRRLGQHVDRRRGHAGAADRRAQADRLDDRRGRHAPDRRRQRHAAGRLGRRRRRHQLGLGAHPRERRGGDGGHGHGRAARAGGEPTADRRLDVRRDDAMRDACGRGARRARLRGPDVPHDGHRRPLDGGADRRRLHRRRARRDHDGAVRRARRRRARRRARPPHGGGARGPAASGLAGGSRHGQLRAARDRARAVRGSQPVRAQRAGDAHAHDARRSARSWARRSRASSRQRPARSRSSCPSGASR